MSERPPLEVRWLGRVPYREALRQQRAQREAVIAGRAADALWLLEHDPVITTGRRAVDEPLDPDALAARGLDLVATERGGLATWHGPGQLVGYLIADLYRQGLKVRTTVAALEQGLIDWLGQQGVSAGRREGYPGVWVGRDKIAALGLHFRRGVSMHGFALNLDADLAGFGAITPCGITDAGVTSLAEQQGSAPDPRGAAPGVGRAVIEALRAASG